jgi:hypothetical protein
MEVTGNDSHRANAGPLTFNSQFASSDPNGSWTLFIADLSGGSVSTLNSFSLDLTAVPEPVSVALGIFGGTLWLVVLTRSRPVRRRLGEKRKS